MSKKVTHSQVAVEYLLLLAVLLLMLLSTFANEDSSLRKGIKEYVDELGDSVADVIQ